LEACNEANLQLFLVPNKFLLVGQYLQLNYRVYTWKKDPTHGLWQWFLTGGTRTILGVLGAKAGCTKHQSLQGYTLWKFKPDFIEHSS